MSSSGSGATSELEESGGGGIMCWKVVLGLVEAMNVGAVVVSANGFFVIFAAPSFWVGCTSQQFGRVLCMGTDRLTS
jgi:hypothetical protein